MALWKCDSCNAKFACDEIVCYRCHNGVIVRDNIETITNTIGEL